VGSGAAAADHADIHGHGRIHESAASPSAIGTALRVLGVLGLLAYFNFGSFHFGGIHVHLWDSLHHVLGAKYIDEIRYDGLYDCIAVADAEDPEMGPRAAQRVLTDLRTNRMTTAADVVAHPERCKARFSGERWSDFKADVAFFGRGFPRLTGRTSPAITDSTRRRSGC
jgi:hypothetical protein